MLEVEPTGQHCPEMTKMVTKPLLTHKTVVSVAKEAKPEVEIWRRPKKSRQSVADFL